MKHKIEIIFHTGYGKTATTTLQRILNEIAESNEILYLGKCKEGKFINPEFEKIYYDLFIGFTYQSNFFQHPSRIVYNKLNLFIEIIYNLFRKSKKRILFLSNENLGSYINYIANLNYSYLKYIGDELENKFKILGFKVEKKIILTIRNQVDMINSYLSYNGELINKKIFFRLQNPEDLFFGTLDYYKNKKFLEKYMKDWKIKLIPMEIITNNGIEKFLEEITNTGIILHENLKNVKENSNKTSPPESKYYLRKNNLFNRIMFRKMTENYHLYINKKRFQRFYFLNGIFLFIYKLLYNLSKFRIKKNHFKPSKKFNQKIILRYSDDNKILLKELKHYNLKEYKF